MKKLIAARAIAALALVLVSASIGPIAAQDPPEKRAEACGCAICAKLKEQGLTPADANTPLAVEPKKDERTKDAAVKLGVRTLLADKLEGLIVDKEVTLKKEEQQLIAEYAEKNAKKDWPTDAASYGARFDLVVLDEKGAFATIIEVEHDGVFGKSEPHKETREQWIKYARISEALGIPFHVVVPEGQREKSVEFLKKCLDKGEITDRAVLQRVWSFKTK